MIIMRIVTLRERVLETRLLQGSLRCCRKLDRSHECSLTMQQKKGVMPSIPGIRAPVFRACLPRHFRNRQCLGLHRSPRRIRHPRHPHQHHPRQHNWTARASMNLLGYRPQRFNHALSTHSRKSNGLRKSITLEILP